MDLRLRVEAAGRPARDVLVEVDARGRIADLTAALARGAGMPAGGLYCPRRRSRLPPDQSVLDSQLRQGERL
ncbi:MAG TPA: hypothetical protein VLW53_06165, partial [Candidatus Eisenbacteria bacterium]|nr:hypothetical protein [Candidatus Eisenbacteria bacterium]